MSDTDKTKEVKKELQEAIASEILVFLQEHKEEIIRRAHKKISAQKPDEKKEA